MGTVSTTLPADGQTIDASDVNTPINAILSEFNGNIDDNNIKTGANINGAKILAGSLPGTALDTTLASGWLDLADTPDTVTYNGNGSYDLVFNSTDLTDTVSEGMRLRATRTVSAPTQCTDLESSSSQGWTATNATGLATGTTWTWKAKIKPESYGSIMAIAAIDDGTNRMEIRMTAAGQITIAGGTTAVEDLVTCYQSLELNKWHDVTASITIGTPTGEIRINDTVVASVVTASAATTMTISGDEEIYVGRDAAGNYFDGEICQVALFNAVISDATLKTYSGQTMTGAESSCEGFWALSGSGADASANGNTLVAGGGAGYATDSPFGSYLGGTLEYGIITKTAFSTNTTLTVQVPEGCALPTSGGISAMAYSTKDTPYLFPRNKNRWQLICYQKNVITQSSPVSGTTYNLGGLNLNVPVGAWNLDWSLSISGLVTSGGAETRAGINTSSSAMSSDLTQWAYAVSTQIISSAVRNVDVVLASATPYYILANVTGTTPIHLEITRSSTSASYLKAIPAYL